MKSSNSPEESLRRVLKTSRLNGWSVAVIAGLFGLLSLAMGDYLGFVVSLLVAVGGAFEVRGNLLLKHGASDGMRWLMRGQFVVLSVIWAYAVIRLATYDEAAVRKSISPDMQAALNELGYSAKEIVRLSQKLVRFFYLSVMAATLIYQGGMALYYWRHTASVIKALVAPPPMPVEGVTKAEG